MVNMPLVTQVPTRWRRRNFPIYLRRLGRCDDAFDSPAGRHPFRVVQSPGPDLDCGGGQSNPARVPGRLLKFPPG